MTGDARLLLVVLTKGVLRDTNFVPVLLGIFERNARPALFPVRLTSPSTITAQSLRRCCAQWPATGARTQQWPEAQAGLLSLLTVLAQPLSPHASMRSLAAALLDVQVMDISVHTRLVLESAADGRATGTTERPSDQRQAPR